MPCLRLEKRFVRATLAVALLLIPAAAWAQQKSCTQMWCTEGTTVELKGNDWPPGRYRFTVDADGKQTVCTSRLPFPSCENNTTCEGGGGVTIGESGCATDPSAHSFYAIMLEQVPSRLGLLIEHESGKSFMFGAPVNAQCGYPNGEECDPRPCCSASLGTDVKWED